MVEQSTNVEKVEWEWVGAWTASNSFSVLTLAIVPVID